MATPPMSHGGNSMIEMLKAQMMTMTMVSSMNNHGGTSSSQHSSSITSMVYIFLLTAIIEFISNSILPTTRELINKYFRDKLKSNRVISDMMKSTDKQKTASITVYLNVSDHENVLGQALLDYITNNENTKHISLRKQNFVLNQTDIIEISEEFFIKLKELNQAEMEKSDGDNNIEQVIELFSYTKTMQDLRSFLNKISHEYKIKIENKLGDKLFFFNQHPTNAPTMADGQKDYSKLPNNSIFTMKVFQTNRKFSNLFGPEICSVKKRVEFFIKNRKWYDSKGIPYTLGLLLSGQAGAGKTSTIKCLANETKRHIININLNNDITKTQLENLFFNELIVVLNVSSGVTEKYYIPLDKRIYVLEDIDCQSALVMDRQLKGDTVVPSQTIDEDKLVNIQTNPYKTETKVGGGGDPNNDWTQAEKLDLSFLLNLLDGVLENPGRIVIMTSNYPEKLDHALIRPGRIDVSAHFTKCSHTTMIEMMEFFYDITLSREEKDRIMTCKENEISPAEMGKIMFENFENYQGAITKIFTETENKTAIRSIVDNTLEDNQETTQETTQEPSEKKENIFHVTKFMRAYDNSENDFRELLDNLSPKKRELIEEMTHENRRILFNRIFMDEDYQKKFELRIDQCYLHNHSDFLVDQIIEKRKNEETSTKYILLNSSDSDVKAYLDEYMNKNNVYAAFDTMSSSSSFSIL